MGVFTELKPQSVWRFFEDLCGIPHGSGNEKGVSDYCVAFAKERGLEVHQDDVWNVVIIKEASEGYEDAKPLILQGHLDMVCEKKADCDIDFEKDGLRLAVDGDYVYAKGTTLGGDDGIAVAYALAVLDDDSIPHPRLEAVFTTCEEVGMEGATALDVSMLKGHTVINMDSEEEGILLVGCAGGCGAELTIPVQREKKQGIQGEIVISGLQGGHSGTEIGKGRGNANKVLSYVLGELGKSVDYALVSAAGGQKDNAIPRESRVRILLQEKDTKKAEEACVSIDRILKKDYASADPNVTAELTLGEWAKEEALTADSRANVEALLDELPNGVISMSQDIPGLVQTSLNLGVLNTTKEGIKIRFAVRSSMGTEKEELLQKLRAIVKAHKGEIVFSGDYPAWEYRKDSPLREKCVCIYEELFGKKPRVEAIHAGLECGLLASKIQDLDCVSFGPDMLGVHTTEERMSISSVERMWKLLVEIVKRK